MSRLNPKPNTLYPKKSLGQHFLHSKHYLEAVANAAGVTKGMPVLEIGPGDGALTAVLLAQGAKVTAVEKDHRLIPVLAERFAAEIKNEQLTLIEADALEFEPNFPTGKYAVIGNIPYYITGALIRKYLTLHNHPAVLVFLIQKEVAERITNHGVASKNPKESILSLSVQAYGTPKYVLTVPRGAFVPVPKVDSAILAVQNVSRGHFKNKAQEERFFALVKAGFAQKRKLLKRNLEEILGERADEALIAAGVAANARAEDVPLAKWLALSAYKSI